MKKIALVILLLTMSACSPKQESPYRSRESLKPQLRAEQVGLGQSYDEVIKAVGEADKEVYVGNEAVMFYSNPKFLMYPKGECRVVVNKRKVESCSGCEADRFPCINPN